MAIDLFAWAASSPTLLVQLADDDLGVHSHYKGDEYKRITHPTHRLPRRHASQSYILVVRPDLQFCHIYTLIFLKAPKGLDHVPLECGNPHLEQLRLGRATTSNFAVIPALSFVPNFEEIYLTLVIHFGYGGHGS